MSALRQVEASKTARHEEGGIVSAVPDGLMPALVLLAYDLYVLRDPWRNRAAVDRLGDDPYPNG